MGSIGDEPGLCYAMLCYAECCSCMALRCHTKGIPFFYPVLCCDHGVIGNAVPMIMGYTMVLLGLMDGKQDCDIPCLACKAV